MLLVKLYWGLKMLFNFSSLQAVFQAALKKAALAKTTTAKTTTANAQSATLGANEVEFPAYRRPEASAPRRLGGQAMRASQRNSAEQLSDDTITRGPIDSNPPLLSLLFSPKLNPGIINKNPNRGSGKWGLAAMFRAAFARKKAASV